MRCATINAIAGSFHWRSQLSLSATFYDAQLLIMRMDYSSDHDTVERACKLQVKHIVAL